MGIKLDDMVFLKRKHDCNDYATVVFSVDGDGCQHIAMFRSDGSKDTSPCARCPEKHPKSNVCGGDIWCYPHNMCIVGHDRNKHKELLADTIYAEGAEAFFAVYDDFEKY